MVMKKKAVRQSSKRTLSSRKAATAKRAPSAKKASAKKVKAKKGGAVRKTKQPGRIRTSRAANMTVKTLDSLNERLDIILPEVMFRIAAIEHLLVKNQLCSYDELVNARQFIQEQERS